VKWEKDFIYGLYPKKHKRPYYKSGNLRIEQIGGKFYLKLFIPAKGYNPPEEKTINIFNSLKSAKLGANIYE